MASGQERSNSEQVRGQQRAENRDGNSSTNALFDLTGASNMNLDLRGLVVQNFPKLPAATPSVLSPDRQRDMEEQFIAIFNTFTNEKTQDKVTSTFLNLNNPDGQVNPEFVVTNYYQGETSPTSSEYVPTLSRNFDPHRDVIGQIVPLKNILNGVCYVALVASAGSGKTISAKRFARMALRKELSSLAGVVLIHYVNIAELDWKSAHTAFDLLFVQPLGARLNKEFRDFGFEWMKTNANKVLLVLDGLDQAPWYMKEEITISYDNPAAAPVVFHNVLNKDLLHDCRIVITSREHSIRHFKQPIRPHRTVTLSGLTIENREYLMKQLGGEHGEGIWKHLQSHSPGLVSLCETPAFLVFTAAVLIDNLENPPTTMTGVLARVLLYFLNSEQQRAPGDIEETFDKLTSLAFKGTSERRVIFKGSELRASGLSVEKVSDFVAIAPKRTRTHHFKIMEGNMNLFFCHQLIQVTSRKKPAKCLFCKLGYVGK
ncbi:protein NLRC5-like isoform X1 [Styela clava]